MSNVHKLPSFKLDDFLDKIRRARQASVNHLQAMVDIGIDGPYDKTDEARELGYQEAMSQCEYWYNRRKDRDFGK